MAPPVSLPIDWVLRAELAIGPAPLQPSHLVALEQAGVRSVLSLCSVEEAPPPAGMELRFQCSRLVLADHRQPVPSSAAQLAQALALLEQLWEKAAPVYVHCVAAVERSPLVCMGWLMRRHGLSRLQALDYLMQIHPGSSPLPHQLALLDELRAIPPDQRGAGRMGR